MHMEGQTGIVIEMGTTDTQISVGAENAEVSSENSKVTTATQSADEAKKQDKKLQGRAVDPNALTETKPGEEKNQLEQQEQPQPEDKLTEEQIKEEFDELWDSLDGKSQKRFDKLLKKDQKDKNKKFIETSVELLRSLKLMFAIISLVISPSREPKIAYTGEDLKLDKIPPEGDDKKYFSKDFDRTTPQESWDNFRKEIEGMNQPMRFGEFMKVVLAANTKHSKDIVMVKPDDKEGKSKRKLELLKTLIKEKLKKNGPRSLNRMSAPSRR